MAAAVVTEEEAALYDRQIRLWGLDAQARLQQARVLVVGMGGLAAELCKNLVLAGVGGLTMMDETIATEEDLTAQFLIDAADVGHKTRAQASYARLHVLNPRVALRAEDGGLVGKDDAYLSQFQVVCVTQATTAGITLIDSACRAHGIAFFAADVFGMLGYIFSDLGRHEYTVERKEKVKEDEVVTVTRSVEEYVAYADTHRRRLGDLQARKLARFPRACFAVQMLQRYRDAHGHLPDPATLEADRPLLASVHAEYLAHHGLAADVYPLEAFERAARAARAELAPVAAIVGGELAQEVLKAVTHKDLPFNNFFFFDGIVGSAQIETFS